MTRRLDNGVVVTEEQEPDECETCSHVRELRPYGPRGENICFECAILDEESTSGAFKRILRGEEH